MAERPKHRDRDRKLRDGGGGRGYRDHDADRDRDRRRGFRDNHRVNRETNDTSEGIQESRRPIILTKSEKDKKHLDDFPTLQQAHRARDVKQSTSQDSEKTDTDLSRSESPSSSRVLGRRDSEAPSNGPGEGDLTGAEGNNDVGFSDDPPFKDKCVRLVDDQQQFCASCLGTVLMENPDFLVVGVIGAQSSGKSTIMNAVANHYSKEHCLNGVGDSSVVMEGGEKAATTKTEDDFAHVFRVQSFEKQMLSEHCTNGIKAWIEPTTRLILLDCQPLNSLSILDRAIQMDKKHTSEFVTAETTVQVQSLQFCGFLMAVCHTILVVQDHFVDTEVLQFLRTSEMLRPSSPAISFHEDVSAGATAPQVVEYFPDIVFVHNKCVLDDFTDTAAARSRRFYSEFMNSSQLRTDNEGGGEDDINVFFIPDFSLGGSSDSADGTRKRTFSPGIDFNERSGLLRRFLLSSVARPLTTTKLTEKTWLNFAQKSWENIKSCAFYSEYGRLYT